MGDKAVPPAHQNHRVAGLTLLQGCQRLGKTTTCHFGVPPAPDEPGVAFRGKGRARAVVVVVVAVSREGVRHKEMIGMLLGQRLDLVPSQNVVGSMVDKEEVDAGAVGRFAVWAFQRDASNLQEGGDSRPAGHQSNVLPSAADHRRRPVHHPLSLELGLDGGSDLHVTEVLAEAPALLVGIGLDDQIKVPGLVGMTHGTVGLGQGLVTFEFVGWVVVDLDAGWNRGILAQNGPSLRKAVPEQKGIVGQLFLLDEFVGLFDLGRYGRYGGLHSALHGCSSSGLRIQRAGCASQKRQCQNEKKQSCLENETAREMIVAFALIARNLSFAWNCCCHGIFRFASMLKMKLSDTTRIVCNRTEPNQINNVMFD